MELNAWNQIPLEDYELHMQHETVAQAQLLSNLTNKYLRKHSPKIPLFLPPYFTKPVVGTTYMEKLL